MDKKLFCEDWQFCQKGRTVETINLPHDAMQKQGRKADSPTGTGGAFFEGGYYVYKKKIWAPEEWKEQDIILEFEGVYPNAAVYLNGNEIGGCKYGYTLFRVSLQGLRYNMYNDLCVEVDNTRIPNSRWYSGAGIYRPVWLLTGNKKHIKPEGIRITTVSYEPAEILVEVEHTKTDFCEEDLQTELYFKGKKISEGTGDTIHFTIPDAHLWDAESPDIYDCEVTLKENGNILDKQSTQFGIRKIEWTTKGLTVNGKNVLLKGGCIHHDNGILGARSFSKSEWRRIKRLKENGFNAIRAAHNPICRSALEACDALGMYVMDETWDMWNVSKNVYDYANDFMEHYAEDIKSIVEKDYNHPSVIMYSIGNEITEPRTPQGLEIAEKILQKMKELDVTRPITAGINLTLLMLADMENNPLDSGAVPNTEHMNSTAYNKMISEMGKSMVMAASTEAADKLASPILDMLDISGYNYAVSRYANEGNMHPKRIIVGTETYAYDLPETWGLVEKYPYVIGDFMWAAWDYLGEAGIGSWSYGADEMGFEKKYPWLLADTGAFDILGNDNAQAGMAAVVWGQKNSPYIGVSPINHPGIVPNKAIWRGSNALPYWSYQGCEGNETEIEVYSSAYEVELLINGKTIETEKIQDFKAVFHTQYEPGELQAIAYNEDGYVHSKSRLRSADSHTQICISPEESSVKRGDILYVDISLTGQNGEVECNRDTTLEIIVEGGELLAFGSANPKTEEDFLSGKYTTYYGRSQAVVRANGEQLLLQASGQGLDTVSRAIPIEEREVKDEE